MTGERIGIVSARTTRGVHPAQTCANEFEAVMATMLQADILPVLDPDWRDPATPYDRLIFCALSYWQISRMMQASASLRQRSGLCHAYVFDAFHRYLSRWVDRFPARTRPLVRLARHELRTLRQLQSVFMPVSQVLLEQQAFLGVPIHYLPIGVDAVRFGYHQGERPIDINGYGRQPPTISNMLSDRMNGADGNGWYHHTDHMRVDLVIDPERHRRLFWRTLTASKVALAYSADAYDPHGRFDGSFVGQRWFESAAAGCAIAGRRPTATETTELFDWPDALIELPDEPDEAFRVLSALIAEPERLARIAVRNRTETLRRHDWRHRVAIMVAEIGMEPRPAMETELSRLDAALNRMKSRESGE